MRKVIEKNRLKVYDDEGNLIEERDATLEDLINFLTEELEIEISIPSGEKGLGLLKKKKKETR
ncbi:MAG: hypothetical protein QXV79_03655 [Thermofilaceae archaeon]